MIDTLQGEGYQVTDRELIRLRLKLKLLLRQSVPRPKRKQTTDGSVQKTKPKKKRAKVVSGSGLINQLANAILAEESSSEEESESEEEVSPEQTQEAPQEPSNDLPELPAAPLSTEEVSRQQLRQEQRRIDSDEKWRTRKRRRRTRGWAGLPADAPGEPPRFPSETTIDEAKAFLALDNNMYKKIRDQFLEICRDHAIVKKTISGPEKWAEIVKQLIREDTHLSSVFEQEPEALQSDDALYRPKGQRALSLDVICMDVTKRLRNLESRMSLADAKNILCLNPEQTRKVRNDFREKLLADNFTNKVEAGEEHWTALKQAWVNESEYMIRVLAQGEADPDYARKLKAVEVLARDIRKRQQQEKCLNNPNRKKHQGPGPGPAPPLQKPHPSILRNGDPQVRTTNIATVAPPTTYATMPLIPASADLQIDPSLLLAASDAAILPTSTYQPDHRQHYQAQDQYQHHRPSSQPHRLPEPTYQPYYPASSSSNAMPLPIYFRLHPHSSTPFPSKTVWLSILHTATVNELRSLAMREHPGTVIHKIEGMITYRGGQEDREVAVEVGDDEELGAYLGHVRGDGGSQGKATFAVLLGSAEGFA
jgi:hypothetical protein